MRLKKPIVTISAVGLLALAACGGSDDTTGDTPGTTGGSPSSPAPSTDTGQFPGTVNAGKCDDCVGPAPDIEGAKTGGTLTVLKADTITTLDPTESYYTDSASILSGLITRSLTQYKWDADTKEMVLVPDLATNLGRPNKD